MKKPTLLLAALLVSPAAAADLRTFSAAGLESVEISASEGRIEVLRGGSEISVEFLGDVDPDVCLVEVSRKKGKLVISVKGRRRWYGWMKFCGAGLRVRGPAHLLGGYGSPEVPALLPLSVGVGLLGCDRHGES